MAHTHEPIAAPDRIDFGPLETADRDALIQFFRILLEWDERPRRLTAEGSGKGAPTDGVTK